MTRGFTMSISPFEHGRFTGGIGKGHVWRIWAAVVASRFWFNNFYFRDVGPAADLAYRGRLELDGTDCVVIYGRSGSSGLIIWRITPRLGTYAHVDATRQLSEIFRNFYSRCFVTCAALWAQEPQFTKDNRLTRPADYREWIFLSSGLGMTYGAIGRRRAKLTPSSPMCL